MLAAMCAQAQRLEVVDADGHGIPLVSVLTEDGTLLGTTDFNGVLANVKGNARVTLTHVAFKSQVVTMSSLVGGRVTMEDSDYRLAEVVIKPKPYLYVETLYRVYVYRNDSLCYFASGIMPNACNVQKQKREHGSYYQARTEYCSKFGAATTWSARAHVFHAGLVRTMSLEMMEQKMKEMYYVTATANSPSRSTYSNPQGTVGYLTRTNGQVRMTLDGGTEQMYANEVKGETKLLKKRQEMGYEYQYVIAWTDDEAQAPGVENFLMESNHWEYNDNQGHVKFFVETYATDHYYMDKAEWKARKKSIKADYGSSMTLDQLAEYERHHHIPALSPATFQAICKLKNQW